MQMVIGRWAAAPRMALRTVCSRFNKCPKMSQNVPFSKMSTGAHLAEARLKSWLFNNLQLPYRDQQNCRPEQWDIAAGIYLLDLRKSRVPF